MDSLTQAALGAAVGEAILGKKIGNKAAIVGAIIATVPDLDVLLMPLFDDFQRISVHRGYSHSISFCLLGAFLFAFILTKIKWTKESTFRKLWLFSFLTLFTHVLLDAFTSYGTQLFLPFTDWRVSLDSISIIDPTYTVPLLLGVLFSNYYNKNDKKRGLPNNIGLVISSLYLLFTLANKQNIEQVFQTQLEEQNIQWFAQGFYTVAEKDGKIRIYNMQCDMQGIREFGGYKAPTAFYYEITPKENGEYDLTSGMHNATK